MLFERLLLADLGSSLIWQADVQRNMLHDDGVRRAPDQHQRPTPDSVNQYRRRWSTAPESARSEGSHPVEQCCPSYSARRGPSALTEGNRRGTLRTTELLQSIVSALASPPIPAFPRQGGRSRLMGRRQTNYCHPERSEGSHPVEQCCPSYSAG